jgi:hypothetical protein
MSATSAATDGRRSRVAGSIISIPQPSVAQYSAVPSRTRSWAGERAPIV